MAALILPTRRVVQPQGPGQVDWVNPLARGLVFLDLQPWIGQQVTHGEADYTIGVGAVENTTGQNGRGLRIISEGQNYLTYGLTGQVDPPYSILLQYVLPTSPTAALRLFGNFSANQYGYNLTPSATNGRFATARSGVSVVVTGGVHKIGVVRTVVGVVDATNIRYYEDGVLVGGPTAHGGVVTPTGALRIGADNFGVVNSVRATVFAAGIYNRALSAHEVAALTTHPSSIWQLAKPIERHIWVPVSAGGTVSLPVGLVTEVDSAVARAPAAGGIPVRTAQETDSALARSAVLHKAARTSQETDSALSRAAVLLRAPGTAVETDTALPRSVQLLRAPGIADEVDSAIAHSPVGPASLPVGLASESDVAVPRPPAVEPAPSNEGGGGGGHTGSRSRWDRWEADKKLWAAKPRAQLPVVVLPQPAKKAAVKLSDTTAVRALLEKVLVTKAASDLPSTSILQAIAVPDEEFEALLAFALLD